MNEQNAEVKESTMSEQNMPQSEQSVPTNRKVVELVTYVGSPETHLDGHYIGQSLSSILGQNVDQTVEHTVTYTPGRQKKTVYKHISLINDPDAYYYSFYVYTTNARQKAKINFIKLLRELTSQGLKEAKDMSERDEMVVFGDGTQRFGRVLESMLQDRLGLGRDVPILFIRNY